MRFTVGGKVAVGFGLVVVLGIVSMLIIYHGLDSVKTAMERLAQVKEPSSAAAFEMEIHLHGLVADVLGYSDTGDPQARSKVRVHDARFAEFRRQCLQLAETPEGKELGRTIGRRYDELKAVGEHLIARKDEQETRYAMIAENFENMDTIIDEQLQPRVSGSTNLLDLILIGCMRGTFGLP
jgi:hypothetical protein